MMAERENEESVSPVAAAGAWAAAVGSEQLTVGEREKSKKKAGRSSMAKQPSSSSVTSPTKRDTSSTEVAGMDAITAEVAQAASDAGHDPLSQTVWPGQACARQPRRSPHGCTRNTWA